MNVADRIGLLPGFSLVADRGFWTTLVVCLIITPGLHQLVGIIGESRWVPWSPYKQFLSYFPGDVFLGVTVASLLVLGRKFPEEYHFYNDWRFHLLVLATTVIVAVYVTWLEYNDPNGYGHRAVRSPTKLYHNIVLYGGYGYVIVVTLFATVAMLWINWSWDRAGLVLLCLLPGLVWVSLLILENRATDATKRSRVEHAHVNDWQPIWRR